MNIEFEIWWQEEGCEQASNIHFMKAEVGIKKICHEAWLSHIFLKEDKYKKTISELEKELELYYANEK